MDSINKYDYIIIGGGSGGIASARQAAKYGKKILVIEHKKLGGTCVNAGCVPKKIMFMGSSELESIRELERSYGL
jgi:glutathione reductase (NADPH)